MSLVRTLKRFGSSLRRGGTAFAGRRSRQRHGSRPGLEVLESRLLLAADFNGDGFADLAIAAPYEDIGSVGNAGAVHILYGSEFDLRLVGNQRWDEGMFSGTAAGDRFGFALAAGDFNGDGYDDLAVGIPYKDIGSVPDAGAVRIIYGSAAGLTAAGSQLWHQNSSGVADTAEEADRFGRALAAGDFNGNGRDDLAIGVPEENIGLGVVNAGVVHVLYGTAAGLSSAGSQLLHQNIWVVLYPAEDNDSFGRALAVGDFDGDGFADLAIGVPYEDINGLVDAGAVNVLYGGASGLGTGGAQLWHLEAPDISASANHYDHLGSSLAAGDFNGDGYDDLAIGVPNHDDTQYPFTPNNGAVLVLRGSSSTYGLSATSSSLQIAASQEGSHIQADARFGHALTTGDFDGDGYDDLAIGAPYEDVDGVVNAGAVYVRYGEASGMFRPDSQRWHQDVAGVQGTAEAYDYFGISLAAGDFDSDGKCDLAIGVPYEDVGDLTDAGAVQVLYGSYSGLTASGNQLWHQDSAEIIWGILYEMEGGSEPGDVFGFSLA